MQSVTVLYQTHSPPKLKESPKEDHLKYTFEKSLPSTAEFLSQREQESQEVSSATASSWELVSTAAAVHH